MQNINPTKHRNRRAIFYLSILGVPLVLLGCVALASIAMLSQLPLFGSLTLVVQGVLLLLAGGGFVVGAVSTYRGITLAHDNELAFRVGEVLGQSIGGDPRYRFIRNVSRRGLGYIDAVLVGPPGALVFRVLDVEGTWRNEHAEWKVMRNGKFRPAPINPSRECARDVYALRKFLKKRKLEKIPVYGVVVFTNLEMTLQGQGQVVPITKPNRLFEVISRDYLTEERIKLPQIEAAVDAIIDG
ncbi:MAG: NERD domain-containing protein [Anaerolineae bacterium]|nr:NERD domain-containing protein [Anaerolineae bacterium]